MELLIFGANGSVGRHLVKQTLEQGHTVTAFVRDVKKLNGIQNPGLRIHQGDVLDFEAVRNAVKGQDMVFCCLGAGRKGKVRSEGTKNIIRAMEQEGVQRFICQTTLGAGDSWNSLNFFWKRIMFGWLLKAAFEDHQLQEQYIKESSLDWTIVRPAAFTDGELSGKYRHGFFSGDKSITLKISRADVAHFMLSQSESNMYHKKTPGVSY